jgi:hypothetical protein
MRPKNPTTRKGLCAINALAGTLGAGPPANARGSRIDGAGGAGNWRHLAGTGAECYLPAVRGGCAESTHWAFQ